ncbi:MAG: hypothetical protein ABI210_02535 [Abditibacteriaceae bacterium]
MTKRDFAALACKLLGVYFFVNSISAVVQSILMIVNSSVMPPQDAFGWLNLLSTGSNLLIAAITVAIALLLWFKATQCAERIFPEDSLPSTLAADKNLMPIALSVTGVIVLAFTLPHLLSITSIYLTFPKSLGQVPVDQIVRNRIDAWVAVLQVLIGIWLVIGAGHISRMIKVVNRLTQDREA